MSAIAIHAWLQGPRNYAEGLALVKQLGQLDETDIWFLELGETSVSRAQVVQALEEAHARTVRATVATPEVPGKPLVTKADVVAAGKGMARDVSSDGYAALVTRMPPEIKAKHDQVREWAREMNYLRYPERMEKLSTDDERLRDALRVIELDQLIVSAYARIDAWRNTGRDPGEAAEQTRSQTQLWRELTNIRTYLSRHRSGKRPASPAKLAQLEKQEKELQALIDAVPA